MIDQAAFLDKYKLTKKDIEAAKLRWEELQAIHDDYLLYQDSLEPQATSISAMLRKQVPKVHSIKLRIKDPEHLIEKIVRRKLHTVNRKNYKRKITDLIGLRALHLFKDDWIDIHDYIVKKWDLRQLPIANIRRGDPQERTNAFRALGCKIREHPAGYRSIHYLIMSSPFKETVIAEIQVRTIFEEGWSEIDHQIRYPYNLNNKLINHFLIIFNSLAGSADEMGSFIKLLQSYFEGEEREKQQMLKTKLEEREKEYKQVLRRKTKVINTLKTTIDQMNIKKNDKTYLMSELEDLRELTSKHTSIRKSLDELGQERKISRDIQMLQDAFSSDDASGAAG